MRLHLILATVGYAQEMLAALEPESTRNLSFFSQPNSLNRQRDWLTKMEKSEADALYVISDLDREGELVGNIGLHEIDPYNRTARLGMLIFRANNRGRGYGKAAIELFVQWAFDTFGLNKVYVKLLSRNTKGRNYYFRLGFVKEAVLRQEYLLEGIHHDMVLMSILKDKWETTGRRIHEGSVDTPGKHDAYRGDLPLSPTDREE